MSSSVRSNLTQIGSVYLERAFTDIQRALNSFVHLKDSVELFTYPSGKRKNVLTLAGTIPVVYKNNTYHIPVALYLDEKHPYQAPYCYVKPTSEMEIKESKVVDITGRIYLPYLNEWKWPSHSLVELLKVMCREFENGCPVYAKRHAPPARPSPPQVSSNLPYPVASFPIPQPSSYETTTNLPAIPQRMKQKNDSDLDGALKASLITALEEKFREKINDQVRDTYEEIIVLRNSYEKLIEGEKTLHDSLQSINNDQQKMDSFVKDCQEKISEIDNYLVNYKKTATVKPCEWIDEALLTTCPLDDQIFRSYVADCVLEDAQYYISQALKKGHITLTEYLKQIRVISQEQFIHRATLIKAREAKVSHT
uniref:Tumor susceptibility gene 101 protein n=1 Tax=Strongyloides papillosus TaxID=174720 RepID=A0A0N5B869_STREA